MLAIENFRVRPAELPVQPLGGGVIGSDCFPLRFERTEEVLSVVGADGGEPPIFALVHALDQPPMRLAISRVLGVTTRSEVAPPIIGDAAVYVINVLTWSGADDLPMHRPAKSLSVIVRRRIFATPAIGTKARHVSRINQSYESAREGNKCMVATDAKKERPREFTH